ncbi:MAG: TonB-dependent receptor [Thermodesulfobacteriota bacterium]|nr:TonB-dependent receptor [Thermodesulfobacteriota bacterium]
MYSFTSFFKTIQLTALAGSIFLSAVTSPAYSQNNSLENKEDTPPGAVILDTMVVTTKTVDNQFQTGDVDLTHTPSFYTIIERDAFEGRMSSLSDVIEKEAGIQIRQSGGIGSFSSVSLRGSTGEQVMIYLDGILLNDASGGGMDLSNISLSDVASIEIFKGTAPIQFGKPSIGGVINIKTLRAEQGISGHVSTGYGSFNTRQSSALVNHKVGKLDYLFSGEYLDSENDFEFKNTRGTLWNPDDDQWEDRKNNAVQQANLMGKFGVDINKDSRFSLVNQWFQKDQEIASWINAPANDAFLDTKRNITAASLTLNNISPLGLNTVLRVDNTWMEEVYKDLNGYIGLGKQHTENITRKYGCTTYTEWMTKANTMTVTADIHYEHYEPDDLTGQAIPLDSRRFIVNLGIEDTLLLMEGRLSIIPAVRYLHITNKLKSENTSFGTSLDGIDDNETYWNPQIGLKYRVFPWLTLKSNVNQYVREPSFFELFGDRGFFAGNMELESEKGVNRDIGLEASWSFQGSHIESLSVNLIYFDNDVEDLITRVYDARGIGKSDNISSSDISGVEAGVRLCFLKYFTLTGEMTCQDTENNSNITAFDGKELPGRYASSWMGKFEIRRWGGIFFLEYLADRDMYYDTANLLKAKNREEINIGLSYLFKQHWQITADVKNIQDNYYEDFYRYPKPGRSFSASLKYIF